MIRSETNANHLPLCLLMSARSELRAAFLICILLSAALFGQALEKGSEKNETLQQHYIHAQELQQAGKLNDAANEYREFLADAFDELAMGYGLARDLQHTAPLFENALILEPDSPTLLLDYARTALTLGDLDHAKALATEFIQKYPDNHQELAQAHQVLGRSLLKLNRDQEAKKELEVAVSLDPTFPNGYDLAVACLDLGDGNCAAQLFGEMEKSFGDTPEIHMAFGRAYADSDFEPRAIPEFRRALDESPRLPGAHYLLAMVLLATGGDQSHLQSAQTELKKELAITPDDPMTYAALGRIALTQNNYAEAETYLKKSISLDPQSPDSYLVLGQMYFEMHHYPDAETDLRQCILLSTDVSRNRYQVQKAHYLLGRILMQNGKQNAAQQEMQTARDLANETLSLDRRKLAGLMDTGAQNEQASGVQAEGSSSVPGGTPDPQAMRKVEALKDQLTGAVADSYNNLGAIAATNSEYSQAVAYFKQAAGWNPSLPGLDYNWGRAAFAGSLYSDAVPPLTRYLKSHSDEIGPRSVLAISQFMTGDYASCIGTLQPVIGKTDLDPQVEYAYAASLIQTGQIASGIQQLIALEKSHPEISDIHRSLGEALDRQGDKQNALQELRTAIHLSPRDAESHYEIGKMELESGNTTAAIPELESAVQLSPSTGKFHQELAAAYSAARRPADAQKEMDAYNQLRTKPYFFNR